MAKPWGGLGGAGAWALDAERAEEEERELAAALPAPATATAPPAAAGGAASFPSLREAAAAAATAGGGKQKKKKGTTLSLSEFTAYGAGGAPQRRAAPLEPRGLTTEEMMMLPTGPRERSAEELDRSRGFRSYGSGFGSGGGGDRRAGFDDDGRHGPSSRASDFDMPSRADEADNWAMNKKFSPAPMDSGRRDRFGGPSPIGRTDDIDDWSRDKKPLPSRYPSLGSGGGLRDSSGPSDSDRWVRGGGSVLLPHNDERERPRLFLNPPKREPAATAAPPGEVERNRPSPFGAARPREEVLAEKGLDWRKIETEIEQKKTSRPNSSHSSRPNSAHSSCPGTPGSQVLAIGSDAASRARPKVNPFGDAKPREIVLQEKGKDWRKIDLELEHRAVNRPESDEERILKEEISLLKVELKEIETKISDGSDETFPESAKNLSEKVAQMEKQLEQLTIHLDDKIRFGQRPSSGAGRVTAFPPSSSAEEPRVIMSNMDRPHSRGSMDRPHSRGSMDRPHSRGSMEPYSKPFEERWGFQGNRERNPFGGSRSSDRSMTSQRW